MSTAIKKKGFAVFVGATGTSQLTFWKSLLSDRAIDWRKCIFFQLDEYANLHKQHKASCRKYLNERVLSKVRIGKFYGVREYAKDPKKECTRLNKVISRYSLDAAFIGVGVSGHIGFNDPPADFKTKKPYILVDLNIKTKKQKFSEGWFPAPSAVPDHAITMSINQIISAKKILAIIPEKRKATAVKDCFGGKVTPCYPASILQKHRNIIIFLDKFSNSLLKTSPHRIERFT